MKSGAIFFAGTVIFDMFSRTAVDKSGRRRLTDSSSSSCYSPATRASSNQACNIPRVFSSVVVVDQDPYWISVPELCGSGSVFRIRFRITNTDLDPHMTDIN